MGSFVVINGKRYTGNGANTVLESNTNEDWENHFNGNGIDAKWTRHIESINQQLAQTTEYKPGRPAKNKEQQIPTSELEAYINGLFAHFFMQSYFFICAIELVCDKIVLLRSEYEI